VAWFPEAATLALRYRGGWRMVPFEPGGFVLAVALPRPGVALCVLRRDDGVWRVQISVGDGATLEAARLADDAAAAALLPEGLTLYHSAGELVLLDESGTQRRTPLPGIAAAIEPAGAGWIVVHRREPGPPLLVQINVDPLGVYLLPGGAR
jgi:hypothetical protein